MIRVLKSEEPRELAQRGYTCDEVKQVLLDDQYEKCYLCERHTDLDYEVEHLESQHGATGKINKWDNLFLACKYCNDRKKNHFDDIPSPDSANWEDLIEMRMSNDGTKIDLDIDSQDTSIQHLVELLDKLHNGKGPMRDLMEKRFWKLLRDSYSDFLRHINAYLDSPNDDTRHLVVEDLDIHSEYLGLKYNFVKSNSRLYSEFSSYMTWNRQ